MPSTRTDPRRHLLDVNALVALAWDSHVHHEAVREWWRARGGRWASTPVSESGFVRVSANPKVLPHPISVTAARAVLTALRAASRHDFLTDDVSMTDDDVPVLMGHRQVTDAHLLTVARRHGVGLVTFDRGLVSLGGTDVVLLG